MKLLTIENRFFRNVGLLLTGLLFSAGLNAEVKESYSYPELLVTPKASERLTTEAKQEPSRSWTAHLPIQSSALFTLAAGFMAMSDDAEVSDGYQDLDEGSEEFESKRNSAREDATEKDAMTRSAGRLAIGVGGGWLVTTTLMSAMYRPYKSCRSNIKVSGKNKRSRLARERAAEECLANTARTGRRLTMFSAATNFIASALVAGTASEEVTQITGGVAALWAFMPYAFNYHWSDVNRYHQDYKKRIYGPVTSSTILYNEKTKSFGPALMASISF